jgi:hypothetical protein
MKYFFRILIFIFAINLVNPLASAESKDDQIVNKICMIFLREYNNFKDKSAIEKIILRMGRKAYVENLDLWKKNYNDIDNIQFSLHPIMEQMAKIMDRSVEPEKAKHFRNLLEDLTKIAFKNMQIYYLSIKEYLADNNLSCDSIELNIFADALAKKKFYDQKMKLYDEEYKVENEIGTMMKEKDVKFKMFFYSYAFDYFINIRKKIIDQEITDMQYKLWQKSQK